MNTHPHGGSDEMRMHALSSTVARTVARLTPMVLLPVALAAQGAITGTLVDENGQALSGVEVEILELTLKAVTDVNGAFRFDAIPVGRHTITFRTADRESSTETVGILFPGYVRDVGRITMVSRAGTSVVGGEGGDDESELEKSKDPNVLLRGDIAGTDAATVQDVIERLRPRWLRVRGLVRDVAGNQLRIQVYMDGSRRGGPEVLSSINPQTVQELRFVVPRDATIRYGMGHGAGAIEITSRRN